MKIKNNKLVVGIGGPTGVGKTTMSIYLAQKYNIPILSADSRQIYKELNIGSAKPDASELKEAPHYFISSHSIQNPISTGDYEKEAIHWLQQFFEKGDAVIMCGGTGLYHKAVCQGLDHFPEVKPGIREHLTFELEQNGLFPLLEELEKKDPEYFSIVDKKNPRRITRALEVIRSSGKKFSHFRTNQAKKRSFDCLQFFLSDERQALYNRINNRVDKMLDKGLVEEARRLLPFRNLPSMQTVGYSELFDFFEGRITFDEAVRLIKRNSRRYAKRQLTWYRNQGWREFSRNDLKSIESWLDSEFQKREIKTGQTD